MKINGKRAAMKINRKCAAMKIGNGADGKPEAEHKGGKTLWQIFALDMVMTYTV